MHRQIGLGEVRDLKTLRLGAACDTAAKREPITSRCRNHIRRGLPAPHVFHRGSRARGSAIGLNFLAADRYQLLRVRIRQRAQHRGVDHRHDGCRDADAKREGQDGDRGRAALSDQLPDAVTDVFEQKVHGDASRRLEDFSPVFLSGSGRQMYNQACAP